MEVKVMNKERLQEIKDSIDLQLIVAKSVGTRNELAEEEKELYDEVVRLGNVINELEKYIRNYINLMVNNPDIIEQGQLDILYEVLDKLKELKEKK